MLKFLLNILLSNVLSNVLFITNYNQCYAIDLLNINLDIDNSLIIRGEINEETTSIFMKDLYDKKNKENLYLYLDTPGGSVLEGLKIANEVEKYDISCVVKRAYSMGFVILQYCKNRYITKHASIMQHQISYGIQGERAKVESYVKYIKSVGDELTKHQARRIGITPELFEKKTYNDWWLYGDNIIKSKCGDRYVEVYCSDDLIKEEYEIVEYGMYKETIKLYSKCGLI